MDLLTLDAYHCDVREPVNRDITVRSHGFFTADPEADAISEDNNVTVLGIYLTKKLGFFSIFIF